MNDEELLEWYRKSAGAKPEDMSQKEYELNMNRAMKLQQDQNLQQNLATQQANVAKAQQNAQQSASISNEKLMKYLGQSQLATGVASGQKGSDFINANNSYMANRATIANNAAAQQNELLESYRQNKLANEQNAYQNEISILDKYRERELEDKDRAQAEEDRQRELQQSQEDRQRDIEKWELEMEGYKETLRQTIEDFNSTQQEKALAKQEAEDLDWLNAAVDRLSSLIELSDEESNEKYKITQESIDKMEAALESYRTRFHNDRYYDLLVDMFETAKYKGSMISGVMSGDIGDTYFS